MAGPAARGLASTAPESREPFFLFWKTGEDEAPRKMLAKLLWTQETCNPMPSFEVSWNPVGPGLKYDPTVPDAPVLKEAEPM